MKLIIIRNGRLEIWDLLVVSVGKIETFETCEFNLVPCFRHLTVCDAVGERMANQVQHTILNCNDLMNFLQFPLDKHGQAMDRSNAIHVNWMLMGFNEI
jgi:hypothetical protein